MPSAILMGSKPGAAVVLSILQTRGWDIPWVVTSGANYAWTSGPSMEQAAAERGIPVVRQRELPAGGRVDFVISYMYRYRVKPDAIAAARIAAVNFHAGPLPGFGGWAFYNVAILEGAREYGCTCHYMTNDFDAGPILKRRMFAIDPVRETAVSLERRAQEEMIRLAMDFCVLAESGDPLPRQDQDGSSMRYMTRDRFEALKEIPVDADEEMTERYARAFWYPPYPGAYIMRGGRRFEVVPNLVKEQLAIDYHASEFADLDRIAHEYRPEGTPPIP